MAVRMAAPTEPIGDREQASLEARMRFFKGFTNPGRLKIIDALRAGEQSVGDLVQKTGIPQAQVSNALGCLRWCGFVRSRQAGRHVYYSIASDIVHEILRLADVLVAEHASQLYSCVVLTAEQSDDAEP